MKWSPKQSEALDAAARWMRDPDVQVLKMFGCAGTGKTTLAKHLVSGARRRWLFGAFTGKAAYVLRSKGCGDAKTLHSMIYRPAGETWESEIAKLQDTIQSIVAELEIVDPTSDESKLLTVKLEHFTNQMQMLREKSKSRFELWVNSPLNDPDVEGIVVDEVSMVDERLATDLESFGKKILVLGDPFQLPPVGAGGYYTKQQPDIMLTEVHRQALDSGVLRLATMIREGGRVGNWQSTSDCEVLFRADYQSADGKAEMAMRAMSADQVLVGRNETRAATNRRHRELLGRGEPTPLPGDRLVCLRNDHRLGLFNGSQWVVEEAGSNEEECTGWMRIRSEDDGKTRVEVATWLHHFLGRGEELKQMGPERRDMSEFDYSYSLTVHKAQGSQWPSVLVIDESRSFGEPRRWLYTAITRAAERVTVLT